MFPDVGCLICYFLNLHYSFGLVLQEAATFSKHSLQRPNDTDIGLQAELISIRFLHVSSNFGYGS